MKSSELLINVEDLTNRPCSPVRGLNRSEFCSAVCRFDTEDEAVAIANASEVGLAGACLLPRMFCVGTAECDTTSLFLSVQATSFHKILARSGGWLRPWSWASWGSTRAWCPPRRPRSGASSSQGWAWRAPSTASTSTWMSSTCASVASRPEKTGHRGAP